MLKIIEIYDMSRGILRQGVGQVEARYEQNKIILTRALYTIF